MISWPELAFGATKARMVVAIVAVLVLVVASDVVELVLARRQVRRRAPLLSSHG
jgi:hypothetical protein